MAENEVEIAKCPTGQCHGQPIVIEKNADPDGVRYGPRHSYVECPRCYYRTGSYYGTGGQGRAIAAHNQLCADKERGQRYDLVAENASNLARRLFVVLEQRDKAVRLLDMVNKGITDNEPHSIMKKDIVTFLADPLIAEILEQQNKDKNK